MLIEDLGFALVQTLAVVLLGFTLRTYNLMPERASMGMGLFTATVSLPALLFVNMAELSFGDIEISFVVAVLISKSLMFFMVLCMSAAMDNKFSRRLGNACVVSWCSGPVRSKRIVGDASIQASLRHAHTPFKGSFHRSRRYYCRPGC